MIYVYRQCNQYKDYLVIRQEANDKARPLGKPYEEQQNIYIDVTGLTPDKQDAKADELRKVFRSTFNLKEVG